LFVVGDLGTLAPSGEKRRRDHALYHFRDWLMRQRSVVAVSALKMDVEAQAPITTKKPKKYDEAKTKRDVFDL
jgi:hypothetical protein